MANNLFQTVQSNSICSCSFHMNIFPHRIWVNISSSVWSAWWRIIVAVSIGTVCGWTVAPLHGTSIIKAAMFDYKHKGWYWSFWWRSKILWSSTLQQAACKCPHILLKWLNRAHHFFYVTHTVYILTTNVSTKKFT